MDHKYIAIEGVIGIGKTTLARLLQPTFDATVLLEVVEENPFLANFYQDRQRYAFQTQIFFLLSRYHQQHNTVAETLRHSTLVSDYTFAKDELFAWLNLKDDELSMYGRVHAALSEKIPKPHLIVYLHADHEVVMRRIALRDRPYERDMDPNYIKKVAAAYDAWLTNLQEIPVLSIDVSHLDFLANEEDLAHIVGLVKSALAQQTPAPPPPHEKQMALLQRGRISAFQQFHRELDNDKTFDPDLFFNYVLLTGEMGEVAVELAKIWRDGRKTAADGALEKHRAALASELADLLAYIFKLANYSDIDLEKAYQEKMRINIGREWHGD